MTFNRDQAPFTCLDTKNASEKCEVIYYAQIAMSCNAITCYESKDRVRKCKIIHEAQVTVSHFLFLTRVTEAGHLNLSQEHVQQRCQGSFKSSYVC